MPGAMAARLAATMSACDDSEPTLLGNKVATLPRLLIYVKIPAGNPADAGFAWKVSLAAVVPPVKVASAWMTAMPAPVSVGSACCSAVAPIVSASEARADRLTVRGSTDSQQKNAKALNTLMGIAVRKEEEEERPSSYRP